MHFSYNATMLQTCTRHAMTYAMTTEAVEPVKPNINSTLGTKTAAASAAPAQVRGVTSSY